MAAWLISLHVGKSQLGNKAIAARIVISDVDNVSCQLFSDAQGQRAVGRPFDIAQDAILGRKPVTVNSILCS